MKLCTLAMSAIALLSAATIAGASSPRGDHLNLGTVVDRMESRYPGEVVAIRFDGSGDKGAHYHVDMRFPDGGLARLDVDATTLAVVSRNAVPLDTGSMTLAQAAALAGAHLPGEVIVAQLDNSGGVTPHYDVDVRLPEGAIARLKVDAATRAFGWRSPPLLDD